MDSQWTVDGENTRRNVPEGVALIRLRKGIPDDRDDQRREFGFQ